MSKRKWHGGLIMNRNAGRRSNVEIGSKGFFVTVEGTNNEKMSVREFYNLADLFAKVEDNVDSAPKKSAGLDAADELAAAVAAAAAESAPSNAGKRFRQVQTNVRNCLFFSSALTNDEIYKLADQIIDECQSKPSCRFIARCIPVENSVSTDTKSVIDAIAKLIHHHFVEIWSESEPPTYAVEFKARNNDQLARNDILTIVDDQIQHLCPLARVNLSSPSLTILVNVLHKSVLLSCARNYYQRRKFSTRPPQEPKGGGGGDPKPSKDIPKNVVDSKNDSVTED